MAEDLQAFSDDPIFQIMKPATLVTLRVWLSAVAVAVILAVSLCQIIRCKNGSSI